jgi:hypothetical protein
MQPMTMGRGGLRPLQPGEIPPGLTPEQQQQLDAMSAGTAAVKQKIETGMAHDQSKYLANVPPLSPEQQREVAEAQAELARRREQAAAVSTQQQQDQGASGELVVGQPFQSDDGQWYVLDEDAEFHALGVYPDGSFYLLEENEEDAEDPKDLTQVPQNGAGDDQAQQVAAASHTPPARGGGKGRRSGSKRGGKGKPPAAEA